MPDEVLPHVLIIDDQEEQTGLKLELQTKKLATVDLRHPQDVEKEDLRKAQLVLVDYRLDKWDQRDAIEAISLQPSDGLALASILRRHAHDSEKASPTAFAIHTGQIEKLALPLPAEHREHALARINNLEWVFKKATTGASENRALQIAELASAVLKLPKWADIGEGDRLDQLAELLKIKSDEKARPQLIADVESCLPPIHELSTWSHGLAVLRWMLHRILPYPCFLFDSYQLAARLRLDHSEFVAELAEGRPLQTALKGCEYTGILGRFLDTRWWRSRIELFFWESTHGNSADLESISEVILKISAKQLKPSNPADHPVVCVNSSYQPLERFASLNEAVRIRPDDWPPYADPAWTTLELARSEPKLGALVTRDEVDRLEKRNG